MTHRDRVLTALHHQQPDHIPWDYWATPEITERLLQHLGLDDKEALLRHFDVDLRYVTGPAYVGQEFRQHADGSVEDLWGVHRQKKTITIAEYQWTYKHVVDSPLAGAETVADVEAYPRWPSADWWDYSQMREQCLTHAGYAVVNAGDRLDRTAQLKPMMYIRGTEQTFIDLKANPDLAQAIIEHIRAYFLEYGGC